MKKRLLGFLICTMLVSMCVGCGAESTTTEQSEITTAITAEDTTAEQTSETTEESHTHNYTEEITTDATCEADGLKTFTCECGDTYTEAIIASGHNYENYVYNDDATYLADGTETATCVCGLTDTRTKAGSKLEYTYTEMNATMYATQTVNVRNLPNTDGEKIGSLSTNQEIIVIGQCNETSWYKFELDGQTAFVSNSYLSTEKVEVAPPANTTNTTTTECPYPLNQIIDEGGDRVCFFFVGSMNDYVNMTYDCASIIAERHGWTTNWNGRSGGNAGMYGTYAETNYTYNGQKVYQARPATYLIGPNGGGPANATETVICPIF